MRRFRVAVIIAIVVGAAVVIGMRRTAPPLPRTTHNDIQNPQPSHTPDFTVTQRDVQDRAYVVFTLHVPNVRLTLTRPDRADPQTLLAVPGTYTSPKDRVEGYVILDGHIVQMRERQGWDGAVLFADGRVTIITTDHGQQLTRAFMEQVAAQGQSLIQVHLLVHNSAPVHFKPQQALPRRALAILADGTPAIVESRTMIDLTTFATDLNVLGIRDAANLDMGAWSEGWYRDPITAAPVTIGIPSDTTMRQTNWVVLAR